MDISFLTLSGNNILPYIKDLARLRIEIFRDYPYLYEGSLAYEEKYLSNYQKSDHTVFVLVKDAEKVVGVSSALPLVMESAEIQQVFIDAGILPSEVFYFGESLLMKAYRGRGIGHMFFDEREAFAGKCKQYKYTSFFAVQRPHDHPLRPPGYKPLDEFWKKRGYTKRSDITTPYVWKDVDQEKETEKPMVFWLRKLI